jgi:hypothetical protein
MIGVRLDGRLGNQMFQYAFALAVSKKCNTHFFIDQVKERFILPCYFKLPAYSRLLNAYYTRKYKYFRGSADHILDVTNDVNVLNYSNNKYYTGFFQSLKYFESVQKIVKSNFEIKFQQQKMFLDKYYSLINKQKNIVIHIRKTDYTNYGSYDIVGGTDISIPDNYIHYCLKQIKNIENYNLVFISDNIEYCKANFAQYKNARFEYNEPIVDFQLLLHADICIISNSSFSWWGAFLNKNPDKIVFAPKYWMGYYSKQETHPSIFTGLNWNIVHHDDGI